MSEGDANYRDATRGRDAWKQNSFNLNLLSSPPPSSHFACTRTTSYNSLESKHLQPESCLRPRVVPLPPPLAPPPQIALMPPTKEEVAARQMVWDDEFTSGRVREHRLVLVRTRLIRIVPRRTEYLRRRLHLRSRSDVFFPTLQILHHDARFDREPS